MESFGGDLDHAKCVKEAKDYGFMEDCWHCGKPRNWHHVCENYLSTESDVDKFVAGVQKEKKNNTKICAFCGKPGTLWRNPGGELAHLECLELKPEDDPFKEDHSNCVTCREGTESIEERMKRVISKMEEANRLIEETTQKVEEIGQLQKEREIFRKLETLPENYKFVGMQGEIPVIKKEEGRPKALEKKPGSWGPVPNCSICHIPIPCECDKRSPDSSFWDLKEQRYINFQEFQERKRKIPVKLTPPSKKPGREAPGNILGGATIDRHKAPGKINADTKNAEKPGSQAQKRRRKAA